jgi:hypothetical protein
LRHKNNKDEIKRTIDMLLPLLKSKTLTTLTTMVIALGSFGKDAAYISDYVIPFIEHQDDVLRSNAMHALSVISVGHGKTITTLRDLLSKQTPSSDPYTATRIYWVLERIERV